MKKSFKTKSAVIALMLVACLAITGISAYFTDADTAVNTFTIGKVSIDLQEPEWDIPENITPEQDIRKDPQILNDGINDAYVFMEVIVPYANVVTANEDGSKNDKAWTELFTYTVNAGWVELEAEKKVDEAAGTVTHLYAYGTADAMTPLAKDAKTPTLFDYVRFANVVEDEGLEGTTKIVTVNAYAIQTTNINDNKDAIDGNNGDGKVAPAEVWAVVETQAPSTAVSATEDAITDIKKAAEETPDENPAEGG